MTIAEQIVQAKQDYDAVYDAGYEKGKSEGGGDDYYNEFWDIYLDNGNKTNFQGSFFGNGWTDVTFNPNRPLHIKSAVNTFAGSKITDYAAIAERIGGIDFTGCTTFNLTWQTSSITRIGTVDFSSATASGALNNTFYICNEFKTLEKCIVSKENTFPNTFVRCGKLEHIRFEGEIGNNISFADSSLLSSASLESIVNHLSVASTGQSLTLSKKAVNKAFETSEGANDGSTSAKWATLIGTRPNWTIVLI